MSKLKAFLLYVKYHKQINQVYSFAIHHAGDYGYPSPDEKGNWYDRTKYWWNSD